MGFSPAGGAISGADDVAISNPNNTHFLKYNTGTGLWQNTTLSGQGALATGGGVETLNALGSGSGTRAINLTAGNVVSATLSGNTTFTFTGATAGTACSFGLYLTQDATGSRTVTWPVSVRWAGGTAPTISTAANAVDILVFESINGGTTWYGSLVGASFS